MEQLIIMFGQKKFSSETTKSKYKAFFLNKIANEMKQPEHRKNAGEITALINFVIDA